MAEDYSRTLMERERRSAMDRACRRGSFALRWPVLFFHPRCPGRIAWGMARRLWLCVALAATGCAAAAAGTPEGDRNAPQPEAAGVVGPVLARPERPRVAVAGFVMRENTDPRDSWLATAVEETLAWRLRRAPTLIVIPPVRVHQARNELQDDPEGRPEWPRVATALGAGFWLTGQCAGHADAVALQLTLHKLAAPDAAPRRTSLPPRRLFDALDEATRWVLEQLAVEVSDPDRRLVFSPPARSPSAVEYYARALSAARAENGRDAAYYVGQALEYDSRYRPALALLAQLEMARGGPGLTAAAGGRWRAMGDLAQMQGDTLDWVAAETGQGVLSGLTGAFDAAETRLENALALAHEHGCPYAELAAMNSLCDLHLTRRLPPGAEPTEQQRERFERDNLRQAARWQEAGLALLTALDDVVAEAPAANKLAMTLERLGERDAALALHRRALAAAERVGSRRNQALAWLSLGQWYQREERWQEAVESLNRCLELAAEPLRPAVRLALARAHQGRDEPQQALEQLEHAYNGLRGHDDRDSQISRLICLRQMAELARQLGQRERALAALQEALDIAHAHQLPEAAALRARLDEWNK